MKKTIPVVIALCTILATACSNEHAQMLERSVIDAKVDSIVGTKMEDLNRQTMEDLDHRIAIEVKAKADSIVAAKQAQMAQDTAKH